MIDRLAKLAADVAILPHRFTTAAVGRLADVVFGEVDGEYESVTTAPDLGLTDSVVVLSPHVDGEAIGAVLTALYAATGAVNQ